MSARAGSKFSNKLIPHATDGETQLLMETEPVDFAFIEIHGPEPGVTPIVRISFSTPPASIFANIIENTTETTVATRKG